MDMPMLPANPSAHQSRQTSLGDDESLARTVARILKALDAKLDAACARIPKAREGDPQTALERVWSDDLRLLALLTACMDRRFWEKAREMRDPARLLVALPCALCDWSEEPCNLVRPAEAALSLRAFKTVLCRRHHPKETMP